MAKSKKDDKNLKSSLEDQGSNLVHEREEFLGETREVLPIKEAAKEGLSKTRELLEREGFLTKKQMQELRQRIESTELSDDLSKEADTHAREIKLLEVKDRVKKLIEIAKEKKGKKGIIYVVNVAQKMKDEESRDLTLDALHDALAEGGYYEQFLEKKT